MDDQKRKLRDCLWLNGLNQQAGLPLRLMADLIARHGSLGKLMAEKPRIITEEIGGPPLRVQRLLKFLRNGRALDGFAIQAAECLELGVQAVTWLDKDYPERLQNIQSKPPVLFYRGRYQAVMSSAYFTTIIGTRTPTAYGRMAAEKITSDLARRGIVIVSGLARGIDAAAHQSALDAGGLTVAVLGSGPEKAYPAENRHLLSEIAEKGLVISEHPPGTPPLRQYFPARNRILSGLSDAVAVIEASEQSGTMITANFAGDQGRDIFAVPGSIFSAFSAGCNKLIREGAELLTDASDIIWRLPAGHFQSLTQEQIRLASGPEVLPDGFPPEENLKNVCHALRGHPLTLTELSAHLGTTVQETAIQLTKLEMDGLLICDRGRYTLTRAQQYSI